MLIVILENPIIKCLEMPQNAALKSIVKKRCSKELRKQTPVQYRETLSHRLGETSETTLSRWAWTMHFSVVKLQPLITVWPHRFLLERFAHVLPAVQSLVPPQPEDPSLSLSPPLHLHGTREDGPRHPSLRL